MRSTVSFTGVPSLLEIVCQPSETEASSTLEPALAITQLRPGMLFGPGH